MILFNPIKRKQTRRIIERRLHRTIKRIDLPLYLQHEELSLLNVEGILRPCDGYRHILGTNVSLYIMNTKAGLTMIDSDGFEHIQYIKLDGMDYFIHANCLNSCTIRTCSCAEK